MSRIRKDMTIDCGFLKAIDKENVNAYYDDNFKLKRIFRCVCIISGECFQTYI